jgi:hypothetical protein
VVLRSSAVDADERPRDVIDMKTKYDLAIWQNMNDGETYAFPLGAIDSWGEVAYPALNDITWIYKGTLPKGVLIADMKRVTGNRIRCTLAGAKGVNTADWALDGALPAAI